MDDYISTRPYCVLSYSWLSLWMHQLHYLAEADERMKMYHLFLSNAKTHPTDMTACVNDFYTYFYSQHNIRHVYEKTWDQMDADYVTIPLREIIVAMTEKERLMFRALTLDVFYSIIHPSTAQELGRDEKEITQLAHFLNGSDVNVPSSSNSNLSEI